MLIIILISFPVFYRKPVMGDIECNHLEHNNHQQRVDPF